MGYDFRARRREAGTFHLGAFSWPWMLERGLGLIIGYTEVAGGQHIFTPREVRRRGESFLTSPMSNDGFPVSAAEARAMALAARGLVVVERHRAQAWSELPEETRKEIEGRPFGTWRGVVWLPLERDGRQPYRADFVDKAEQFAEWAEKSGGFRVY